MSTLDPLVFVPPTEPEEAAAARAQIAEMSSRELKSLLQEHPGYLRTYLVSEISNWGRVFDKETISLMLSGFRGTAASLMANPHVGPKEASAILAHSVEGTRSAEHENHADHLRALWVAMRRGVLAPDSALLREIAQMLADSGGRGSFVGAAPSDDLEVPDYNRFHAWRIWVKRLLDAHREGARTPEEFSRALMGTYVLWQHQQDVAHRDPAGSVIAEHPQTTPEALLSLLAEYPNAGMIRAAVFASIAGTHEYAAFPGLRRAMLEHLRQNTDDNLVAEALALTPRRADFAEALARIWGDALHRRRIVRDSRVGATALSWLSREWLGQLLQDPDPEVREKSIRAFGLVSPSQPTPHMPASGRKRAQ